MACKDCFNNCGDQATPDRCVQYTGPDIPLLGICSGESSLSQVEEAIIDKLLSALDGTGISVNSVTLTNAPFLIPILGVKDKSLGNLLQMLVDASQTLKGLIDSIQPKSTSFSTDCLSGLPANPTSDQILQATLKNLCQVKTTVAAIPDTYVKLSDLEALVKQYTTTSSSPGSSIPAYKDRMVPGVVYAYEGSLSNFDSTGKGIASAGFDRVFLCNGLNTTKDYRGRVIVGAMKNVPGGTLDAAVDPTSSVNSTASVNYAVGDKFGENFHKSTLSEMAPHTHGVNDPGHSHSYSGTSPDGRGADSTKSATITTRQTSASTTGITIQSAGQGVAFNVRQPSIAANYIIYIP